MENEKEKWIDDVLGSAKGMKRAKPGSDLFAKIEQAIDEADANIIPLGYWRMTAAAAVLLLALNVFALQRMTQENTLYSEELVEGSDAQQLISNYKIYE